MQRGVFRSRDPVENLRVEVTLRKVTAASSDRGDAPPSIASQATYASETRVLEWQQKVFSWAEIIEYRDNANCDTPLEHHYHKEVNNLLQKDRTGWRGDRRIFTYVDVDDYVSEQEIAADVLTGPQSSTSTFVTRRMAEVRQRHGTRGKRGGSSHGGTASSFVHVNDVVTTRPTTRDKSKRVIDTPYQVMHVMADLSDVPGAENADREENADNADLDTTVLAEYADAEHVLCTIKIDANGVLEASPTFNHNGRLPYRIQHKGSIYEYEIKHVSTEISPEEAEQEGQMVVDLHTRHTDLIANKVGKTFAPVPHDAADGVAYHVFGEIVSAKDFEYDNLYVRLVVDVPERTWTWLNRHNAHGTPNGPFVTQISRVSNRGSMADMALFSYPFELEFARKREVTRNETSDVGDAHSGAPTLLLQVNSLDFFARHRPEGYGYIRVPMTSGVHDIEVTTWRPMGEHVTGRMRRFFVGGAPELEDVTYVATPTDHHDRVLSKYGFATETSGTVRVRVHVVTHIDPTGGPGGGAPANGATFPGAARGRDGLSGGPEVGGVSSARATDLSMSTMHVIAAFKRARQRMEQTRVGQTSEI